MKNIIIFGILMILFGGLVSADVYVFDSINTNLPSNQACDNCKNGWQVRFLNDSGVVSVFKDSNTYAKTAYIFNSSLDIIGTASFLDENLTFHNNATFDTPINVTAGAIYLIEIGSDGIWNFRYSNTVSVPFTTQNIEFLNSTSNEVPNIWSWSPTNFTTVVYGGEACVESWVQDLPSACDGVLTNFTISYTDENLCGTFGDLPVDNGTFVVCCVESWSSLFSGSCSGQDKLKFYVDVNNCGTTNSLPSDNGSVVLCDVSGGGGSVSPQVVTVVSPVKSASTTSVFGNFINSIVDWFRRLFGG
jgi:hypothetical protein